MKRLTIILLALLALAGVAQAVNLCSITGTVYKPDGSTCNRCLITFTPTGTVPQIVGGNPIYPTAVYSTTNASGVMTPTSLIQSSAMTVMITDTKGYTSAPVQTSVATSTGETIGQLLANNQLTFNLTNVAGLGVGTKTIAFADSPYSVASTDFFIECNAAGGNVVINLPASAGAGRWLHVKKIDPSVNTCTVKRAGTDTIDGATSYTLDYQYAGTYLTDAILSDWAVSGWTREGGDITANPNGGTHSISNYDVGGVIDLCAHGFGCNAQLDTGGTINNGSQTLTISGGVGGVFRSSDCSLALHGGNCTGTADKDIRIETLGPSTAWSDTFDGTIVGFTSATIATISGAYGGPNTTTARVKWGSDDVAAFNTLVTLLNNTAGYAWPPSRINCHAPIFASAPLKFFDMGGEFAGTGMFAKIVSSTNQDRNGCVIVDVNPTVGTNSNDGDIFDVHSDTGVNVHDFAIDGSTLYPKRYLVGVTSQVSPFRTETLSRVGNISNVNSGIGPSTNVGMTGTCSPAGNISGNTITCAAAPTGLNIGQYLYIYDNVAGPEHIVVSNIVGSVITLATNLVATHVAGNYTIRYDPNIEALGGLGLPNDISANHDQNRMGAFYFAHVDTGVDNRNGQGVLNSVDYVYCIDCAEVASVTGGGDLQINGILQANTSLAWTVSHNSMIRIGLIANQPSATLPPAGTMAVGWCGDISGTSADTCYAFMDHIEWPVGGMELANGAIVQTGPANQKADIKIGQLRLLNSTALAPLVGVQPSIQTFVGSFIQNLSIDVGYDEASVSPWMDLQYIETGTGGNNSFRRVCINNLASQSTNNEPYGTCQSLHAADAYEPVHTDLIGNARTWYLNIPVLAAPTITSVSCPTAAVGATYWYFASLCPNAACTTESALSTGVSAICASPLTSTDYVKGVVIPPIGAAAIKIYRNTVNTKGTAVYQYIVPVNTINNPTVPTGVGSNTVPTKTGFIDNGNGTNAGTAPNGGLGTSGQADIQQVNLGCTAVANLPTGGIAAGSTRCVSDWNATNGACTGGGSTYTTATYSGSGWFCP